MKTLLTSIACLAVLIGAVLAQSQSNPVPAGNTAVLTWDANPASDGVTHYTVFYKTDTGTITLSHNVQTNQFVLTQAELSNGTYVFYVTASNTNGSSPQSTNIWVKYFANKPTAPKGLLIK